MIGLFLLKIFVVLIRQRNRLHCLQAQHSDLLGLLAQQEIEMQIYRQSLSDVGGAEACRQAEDDASAAVTERYGTYVNFRNAGEDDSIVL